MVRFDTVSRSSNIPLADFIADALDRPGVRITRNPSADGTKANLVVHIGPDTDPVSREGLVLSGHMDVVPAEEPEWASDPFALTDDGDRWTGRGTSDMKGFLALAVKLARGLDPGRLHRPLVLLFTFDEELGTLGAKHFVDTFPSPHALPRHAIIGEPTELRAVRAHKGHLKLRIGFRGVTAHSGYPHLGVNAIEPAARAVVALGQLRDRLREERQPTSDLFPEVPFAALNVAQIAGGVAINVVPDQCVIDVGLRVLPGMSSTDLVARVEDTLHQALGDTAYTLENRGESPPLLLDGSAPVYRNLAEELHDSVAHSVAFATDAGWFQTLDMDCVIFGPGSIEVAHKPNESIPKSHLPEAERILARVVARHVMGE